MSDLLNVYYELIYLKFSLFFIYINQGDLHLSGSSYKDQLL